MQTINQAIELSLSALFALADVSGQSGSGEVQRVHEHERGSTGGASGGHVAHEELEGVSLGVVRAENLFVGVLESKVQRLSGEVPDHVCQVSSPERDKALFFVDSDEAVNDALVPVFLSNMF